MMNKTIYLMLLTCLAAACVATREVPLTVNPGVYATAGQLDSLPVLPSDLSQIKYIHLPESLLSDNKGELTRQILTRDCMESYDMVQLEGLPGVNEYEIFDIQSDDNLLFVTYIVNQSDTSDHQFPRTHAIYTRSGKLVAQIGKGIVGINEKNEDGRTTTPLEEALNDTYYFIDSRLELNRSRKEVYFNELGGKQVYFDYKGNYKRTEYSQIISYNMFTTRDRKVGIHVNYNVRNWRELNCVVVGKNGRPSTLAFKNDPLHIPPMYISYEGHHQVDDDLMLGFGKSDTIWQILPDKKVARYVCTGALKVPEKAKRPNTAPSERWKGHIEKTRFVANSKYVLLGLQTESGGYILMYDSNTGHSTMWTQFPFAETTLVKERINFTDEFMMLQDGTLVSYKRLQPLRLKKALSDQLDLKSKGRNDINIDKREEKFIRNLKLDGGPVLFFVKLKKF